MEEPGDTLSTSTKDKDYKKWFFKRFSHNTLERFHVSIPFHDVVGSYSNEWQKQVEVQYDAQSLDLSSSRFLALKHLYILERRLSKDPEFYHGYHEFMYEYISLGLMELVQGLPCR